jgi:hypothetical protein
MKPTKVLHDLGQSLWLDNITRNRVNSGTLQRYIDEFSVTRKKAADRQRRAHRLARARERRFG